jgi:hypothetical protein
MQGTDEDRVRNKKPPAALAGGGLDSAELLNLLDQASIPAL